MYTSVSYTCFVESGNKSTPVELTKKQALALMKESAIARTAVYQWNKLNTAVRILVHKTTVGQFPFVIHMKKMDIFCLSCKVAPFHTE